MDRQLNLWQELGSSSIKTRQQALRMGAEIENPLFVQIFSMELGQETYQKIVLHEDGEFEQTTCPVTLLLGCDDWRVWKVGHVYIAYDKRATVPNAWWEKLRESSMSKKVEQMFGTLVLFRFGGAVMWDELDARRELINFLVTRYRHGATYNFCFV